MSCFPILQYTFMKMWNANIANNPASDGFNTILGPRIRGMSTTRRKT